MIDGQLAKEAMIRQEKEDFGLPPNGSGRVIDPNYTGKGLQIQFTVEDPNVFTTPWSGSIIYKRAFGGWLEYICAENTRRTQTYGDKDTPVPTANKPDF
jgi:hypothetical protein